MTTIDKNTPDQQYSWPVIHAALSDVADALDHHHDGSTKKLRTFLADHDGLRSLASHRTLGTLKAHCRRAQKRGTADAVAWLFLHGYALHEAALEDNNLEDLIAAMSDGLALPLPGSNDAEVDQKRDEDDPLTDDSPLTVVAHFFRLQAAYQLLQPTAGRRGRANDAALTAQLIDDCAWLLRHAPHCPDHWLWAITLAEQINEDAEEAAQYVATALDYFPKHLQFTDYAQLITARQDYPDNPEHACQLLDALILDGTCFEAVYFQRSQWAYEAGHDLNAYTLLQRLVSNRASCFYAPSRAMIQGIQKKIKQADDTQQARQLLLAGQTNSIALHPDSPAWSDHLNTLQSCQYWCQLSLLATPSATQWAELAECVSEQYTLQQIYLPDPHIDVHATVASLLRRNQADALARRSHKETLAGNHWAALSAIEQAVERQPLNPLYHCLLAQRRQQLNETIGLLFPAAGIAFHHQVAADLLTDADDPLLITYCQVAAWQSALFYHHSPPNDTLNDAPVMGIEEGMSLERPNRGLWACLMMNDASLGQATIDYLRGRMHEQCAPNAPAVAMAAYQNAVADWDSAPQYAARAALRLARLYSQHGELDEALAVYHALCQQLDDDTNPCYLAAKQAQHQVETRIALAALSMAPSPAAALSQSDDSTDGSVQAVDAQQQAQAQHDLLHLIQQLQQHAVIDIDALQTELTPWLTASGIRCETQVYLALRMSQAALRMGEPSRFMHYFLTAIALKPHHFWSPDGTGEVVDSEDLYTLFSEQLDWLSVVQATATTDWALDAQSSLGFEGQLLYWLVYFQQDAAVTDYLAIMAQETPQWGDQAVWQPLLSACAYCALWFGSVNVWHTLLAHLPLSATEFVYQGYQYSPLMGHHARHYEPTLEPIALPWVDAAGYFLKLAAYPSPVTSTVIATDVDQRVAEFAQLHSQLATQWAELMASDNHDNDALSSLAIARGHIEQHIRDNPELDDYITAFRSTASRAYVAIQSIHSNLVSRADSANESAFDLVAEWLVPLSESVPAIGSLIGFFIQSGRTLYGEVAELKRAWQELFLLRQFADNHEANQTFEALAIVLAFAKADHGCFRLTHAAALTTAPSFFRRGIQYGGIAEQAQLDANTLIELLCHPTPAIEFTEDGSLLPLAQAIYPMLSDAQFLTALPVDELRHYFWLRAGRFTHHATDETLAEDASSLYLREPTQFAHHLATYWKKESASVFCDFGVLRLRDKSTRALDRQLDAFCQAPTDAEALTALFTALADWRVQHPARAADHARYQRRCDQRALVTTLEGLLKPIDALIMDLASSDSLADNAYRFFASTTDQPPLAMIEHRGQPLTAENYDDDPADFFMQLADWFESTYAKHKGNKWVKRLGHQRQKKPGRYNQTVLTQLQALAAQPDDEVLLEKTIRHLVAWSENKMKGRAGRSASNRALALEIDILTALLEEVSLGWDLDEKDGTSLSITG